MLQVVIFAQRPRQEDNEYERQINQWLNEMEKLCNHFKIVEILQNMRDLLIITTIFYTGE